MNLPRDLQATDDVAVDHVIDRLTVHRPGDVATPCGIPMWSVTHPLPAAGHVVHLHPTWCECCFPHDNAWVRMLAAAYPPRFRTADVNSGARFPHINSSRARPGVGQPTKESR
jgi:hypothetical protein